MQESHHPGALDVSHMRQGELFLARPNFHFFEACGRPCWLPAYPKPKMVRGMAVTEHWPCEAYRNHDRSAGPACFSVDPHDGDWVQVVGQARGEMLRDEAGNRSDVWDLVVIPPEFLRLGAESMLQTSPDGYGFLAYMADLWLGNTGWRDLPTLSG